MSDDWNLKKDGKVFTSKPLNKIIHNLIVNQMLLGTDDDTEWKRIEDCEIGYRGKDIDTLRRKLIKDLKWCGGDMTTESEMKDMINKRFGYE